jgi:hypothetical protein
MLKKADIWTSSTRHREEVRGLVHAVDCGPTRSVREHLGTESGSTTQVKSHGNGQFKVLTDEPKCQWVEELGDRLQPPCRAFACAVRVSHSPSSIYRSATGIPGVNGQRLRQPSH